ncbi:YhcN/YlaJ family sporulation lipoprotein [Paenibacillus sp. sgz500958]|uniref:YhcN/YlaJ family sporulation lipoprotein n=1 Tax=Paenibacillus sp. sgz500958 TaxID=3242475 RepID=UPI0036D2A11A
MLRSTINTSLSVALLLGMVSLSGCGTNDAAGNNKVTTKNVRGVNDGRLNVNTTGRMNGTHNFDRLEMSQDLADRIAAMPEIRTANVMLAGKSAYVAVTLDNVTGAGNPSALGTGNGPTPLSLNGTREARGTTRTGLDRTMTGYSEEMPNRALTGTGGAMFGKSKGITGKGSTQYGGVGDLNNNGIYGTDGNMTGMNGMNGGSAYGGTMRGGMLNSLSAGRGAADGAGGAMTGTAGGSGSKGTMGIGSMGTGNRMNNRNGDISMGIKDKVANQIRSYAPEITTVYVSANPDFVQRVNGYADQARAGYPLQGFVNEFRTMVNRIFPARSDINNR